MVFIGFRLLGFRFTGAIGILGVGFSVTGFRVIGVLAWRVQILWGLGLRFIGLHRVEVYGLCRV